MKISRQQFISWCCVIVFQLGVYASLLHTVEHPFHAENDYCASFINFAKHDVSTGAAQAVAILLVFFIATVTDTVPPVFSFFVPTYHSRAPPLS